MPKFAETGETPKYGNRRIASPFQGDNQASQILADANYTNFGRDVVVWHSERPHKIRAPIAHATTALENKCECTPHESGSFTAAAARQMVTLEGVQRSAPRGVHYGSPLGEPTRVGTVAPNSDQALGSLQCSISWSCVGLL